MTRRTLLLGWGPSNEFCDIFLFSNQFVVGPIKGESEAGRGFPGGTDPLVPPAVDPEDLSSRLTSPHPADGPCVTRLSTSRPSWEEKGVWTLEAVGTPESEPRRWAHGFARHQGARSSFPWRLSASPVTNFKAKADFETASPGRKRKMAAGEQRPQTSVSLPRGA